MKKHTRNFMLAMLAYAVLLIGAVLYKNNYSQSSLTIILMLLPLIPGIFVVISVTGAMMAQDEMMRKVQLEAISLAFGGLFLLTLTEALLAGLNFPGFPASFRIMMMSVFWALGIVLARRKYG